LAGNLVKPLLSLYGTEWRERGYGLSWDQANRGKKLGLVWRNRKKISQIINDYLYLLFFLLIILCCIHYVKLPIFIDPATIGDF
jgi:hypothetical protein